MVGLGRQLKGCLEGDTDINTQKWPQWIWKGTTLEMNLEKQEISFGVKHRGSIDKMSFTEDKGTKHEIGFT